MTTVSVSKKPAHIRRGAGSVVMDVIIYLVMVFVLLVCLVPFLYMIALSFSDAKAIVNNQVSFWPVGFNLGSYEQIVTYPHFFRAYGNTFFYTLAGTSISLLMTMLFAYPLSKTHLRGQGVFHAHGGNQHVLLRRHDSQLPADFQFAAYGHGMGHAHSLCD